jgi:hypothetical protein
MKSCEDTVDAASWVTVAGLSPEVVEDVLECESLRGYVLPMRGEKDTIRIYDWVSVCSKLILAAGFTPQLSAARRQIFHPRTYRGSRTLPTNADTSPHG